MPARTNDFQELVALIEQALAPKGAKVTQSAEVPVHGLETLREVDVLIDGQFGPYKMTVAVEAKDHGRKISLQTFDSLYAKYRGECRVNVDKFVIVSSRGFTEGVIEKAAATDVELLTIQQAKEKKWATVGPSKMQFRVAPHVHNIVLEPKPQVVDYRFAVNRGRLICRCPHDHGTPLEFGKRLFFQSWLPKNKATYRDVEQAILEQHQGNGLLTLTLTLPGWKFRLGGIDQPVESIGVAVHVVNRQGSASHKAYERTSSTGGKKTFHHIAGTAGDQKMEILFGVPDPAEPLKMPDDLRRLVPDSLILKLGSVESQAKSVRKQARPKGNRKHQA